MDRDQFQMLIAGILLAGLGGIVWHHYATADSRRPPYEPYEPTPEVPVVPYVWPSFQTYSTNDTPPTAEQIEYVYSMAHGALGQYYGLNLVDTRYNHTWKPEMVVEVPTSFNNTLYQAVQEVIDYYNEIFELAGTKQRFTVKRVSTLSNTAEIGLIYSSSLPETVLGRAHNLPSHNMEWGETRIGTVAMNANRFNNVEEGTALYNTFKRVFLHEISHSLGIDHFENDPFSMMAPMLSSQSAGYWKFSPNDIRNITSLIGFGGTREENIARRDAYASQAAQDYFAYFTKDYTSALKPSAVQDNTVVYYSFDLEGKANKLQTVNITLNQPAKGLYTYDSHVNGAVKSYIGKFYIQNTQQEGTSVAQMIFLDSFVFAETGQLQLAVITNGSNGFKLNIGERYTSRVQNVDGKAYASAHERDNALAQQTSATAIRMPNYTITLPSDVLAPKKEAPYALKNAKTYYL